MSVPQTNKRLVELATVLIPKPLGKVQVMHANGDTNDIIKEIQAVDRINKAGTARFARCLLNSDSINSTLENVYWFVKRNINYDVDGTSQQAIKSPQAIWHMRVGDCKSYALFISSLLKNLGIAHQYKFANYGNAGDNVTHIYVVVGVGNTYITLDPCMPSFNKEKKETTSILITPYNGN